MNFWTSTMSSRQWSRPKAPPVTDLEIDSFDMMMILGDLENSIGTRLDVTLDTTVGEIRDKVTAAGQ